MNYLNCNVYDYICTKCGKMTDVHYLREQLNKITLDEHEEAFIFVEKRCNHCKYSGLVLVEIIKKGNVYFLK